MQASRRFPNHEGFVWPLPLASPSTIGGEFITGARRELRAGDARAGL